MEFLQDAIFSAIAAIGFAAISRVPLRALPYCAVIAAIGHASRSLLQHAPFEWHLVAATFTASLLVGILAVIFSPKARTPAEACLFPALLPMIPGMYAYKAFGALALCIFAKSETLLSHNFFLFMQNGLTCIVLLICMAVAGTIPIFVLKKISFRATRSTE